MLVLVCQVNRDYVLECFLHVNPVLREVQRVKFEPYGQDTVTAISRDHGAEIFLDRDARKWANKLTKDQMSIADLQKQVKGLQTVVSAYTKVGVRPSVLGCLTLSILIGCLEPRVWHGRILCRGSAEDRHHVGRDTPA